MVFDIVIFVAIAISSVIAFLRGFIRELLTIVGVVGGMAASFLGGPVLAPVMRGWLGVSEAADAPPQKLFDVVPMSIVADICAYGAIFVVVVIALTILSHFLSAGVKAMGLGPADRILGVVFGIARAFLLVSLIYLPIYVGVSDKDRDDWFKGSYTRPYIENASSWIAGFLPKGSEKKVAEASQKMDEMGKQVQDMQAIKGVVEKAGDATKNLQDAIAPKPEGTEAPPTTVPDSVPVAPAEPDQGYQTEQREDLENLIKDNQTTPPEQQ